MEDFLNLRTAILKSTMPQKARRKNIIKSIWFPIANMNIKNQVNWPCRHRAITMRQLSDQWKGCDLLWFEKYSEIS